MRCAYNMASELNSMHRKSRALKKARKHESERGDAPTLNLARLTRRIASRERLRRLGSTKASEAMRLQHAPRAELNASQVASA